MRISLIVAAACAAFSVAAIAQTPIYTQPVKELQPTGTLATSSYTPVEQEAPFLKRLDKNEISTGSFMAPYSIHNKKGKYVSWFGIVRGITIKDQSKNQIEFLLDQKYFDGLTDTHIMLVSYGGSGDFRATLEADPHAIPALSLVRVYGKVVDEVNNVPVIAVEYIRAWPWMTFTFSDLSAEDKSNPIWAKYAHTKGWNTYMPYPTIEYYRHMLGNPGDFGLNWKEQ